MITFAIALAALAGSAAAQGFQCSAEGSARDDCYPWQGQHNLTESKCLAHGCCWDDSTDGIPWCFYHTAAAPAVASCAAVAEPSRMDCHPEPDASQASCEARGCCWDDAGVGASVDAPMGVAACFFPPRTTGYVASAPTSTASGERYDLALSAQAPRGPYGNDWQQATLDVSYETDSRLRLRIADASKQQWEVPGVRVAPMPTAKAANPAYQPTVATGKSAPFGIKVTRSGSGATVFDSTPGAAFGGMVLSDQFMEISTTLSADAVVFGLGEHVSPFALPRTAADGAGQTFTLFARDRGTPTHTSHGDKNLYASHPFVVVFDPASGTSHGIFLLNSNGMDVVLQEEAMTFRVIGGILDMFIFTGPTPMDVVRQYQELIGHTFMPPHWSFGFHLCRWGYKSLANTMAATKGMVDNDLPLQVQWNDIDAYDNHLDFTLDPTNFPMDQMRSFIDTLHQTGRQYIQIIDPAISSTQPAGSYAPADQGLEDGVFILRPNASGPYVGVVWPGETYFPDFFMDEAKQWWKQQLEAFWKTKDNLNIDSAWIDMNEPSNFINPNGANGNDDTGLAEGSARWRGGRRLRSGAGSPVDGPGFDPDFPPYVPGRLGGATNIAARTAPMAAIHPGAKTYHYNVHNMYGWSEAIATHDAANAIRGERSIVISRSTFPGTGVVSGHWLGDNTATWNDLYFSIPGVLSFQLFGINFVGADTCGFNGDTTAELCTRWMQLGSMVYPFYRNHNTLGAKAQEPFVFGEPYTTYMRDTLNLRYTLLPYIYSQFYATHVDATPMVRSIWFEWPGQASSFPWLPAHDKQVMFGDAFLVTPVLEEGATSVTGFFPDVDNWFDWRTGSLIDVPAGGGNLTLDAPLSTIPVHMLGGSVVATQSPNLTTTASALNPFTVVAAASQSGAGSGFVYLDDGVSLDSMTNNYTLVNFTMTSVQGGKTGSVSGKPTVTNYELPASAALRKVVFYGYASGASPVVTFTAGGKQSQPAFSINGTTLTCSVPPTPMTTEWTLSWSS